MLHTLNHKINELKKQLSMLLSERELQNPDVYELSTQLDELIFEYQRRLNPIELKS